MLNSAFNEFGQNPQLDLYPALLRQDIDRWNDKIHHAINNGVYRCGFAQSQLTYDRSCQELFATLDQIEATLQERRYLCGSDLTLADVRLFTTLIRFDIVCYGLFKCNRYRIRDRCRLAAYLREIYHLSAVSETCDFKVIKQDYYSNLFPLNPGGIIPCGPDLIDGLTLL